MGSGNGKAGSFKQQIQGELAGMRSGIATLAESMLGLTQLTAANSDDLGKMSRRVDGIATHMAEIASRVAEVATDLSGMAKHTHERFMEIGERFGRAATELTEKTKGLEATLEAFIDYSSERYDDHETRLQALEGKT